MTRISPRDRLESRPEPSGERPRFKRLSRIAAAIAVLLVLIALATTLPGLALGSDVARQAVVDRLERMTGEPVTIEGDTATITVTRRDVIVTRGRSQNGNSRQQTFVLEKTGGSWVITQIQ